MRLCAFDVTQIKVPQQGTASLHSVPAAIDVSCSGPDNTSHIVSHIQAERLCD